MLVNWTIANGQNMTNVIELWKGDQVFIGLPCDF